MSPSGPSAALGPLLELELELGLQHELELLARTWVADAGVAPAAALAVGARGPDGFRFVTGAAGRRSVDDHRAIDASTPFDLASLTKPMVATAVARLIRTGVAAGRLSWDTALGEAVPELAGTASGIATIELLLSHRAGLEAHRALYGPLLAGEPIDRDLFLLAAAEARRPECRGAPPEGGFPPVYSDLGYLLAGVVASRTAGAALAEVIERELAAPLGSDVRSAEAFQRARPDFARSVAPTEVVSWRGGEIAGAVHDENAWAYAGTGVAGHAGLFGTALGVARFGAAVLDALGDRLPGFLTRDEALPLVRRRPGGTLRAGFDGKAPADSSAGEEFGPDSFGHLGFTGTSLWCDPDAAVVAVILTNRVNPSRDNLGIRRIRPPLNGALHRLGRALSAA